MQEISTFTFKVISRIIDFSAEAETFETLPPQKNYHFSIGFNLWRAEAEAEATLIYIFEELE